METRSSLPSSLLPLVLAQREGPRLQLVFRLLLHARSSCSWVPTTTSTFQARLRKAAAFHPFVLAGPSAISPAISAPRLPFAISPLPPRPAPERIAVYHLL